MDWVREIPNLIPAILKYLRRKCNFRVELNSLGALPASFPTHPAPENFVPTLDRATVTTLARQLAQLSRNDRADCWVNLREQGQLVRRGVGFRYLAIPYDDGIGSGKSDGLIGRREGS